MMKPWGVLIREVELLVVVEGLRRELLSFLWWALLGLEEVAGVEKRMSRANRSRGPDQ